MSTTAKTIPQEYDYATPLPMQAEWLQRLRMIEFTSVAHLLKTLRVSRMDRKAAKFSRRHVNRTSSPVLAAAALSALPPGGPVSCREGSVPASSDASIWAAHNPLSLQLVKMFLAFKANDSRDHVSSIQNAAYAVWCPE